MATAPPAAANPVAQGHSVRRVNRIAVRSALVQPFATRSRRGFSVLLVCLLGPFLCRTALRAQGLSSATPTAKPSQAQISSLLDELGGLRPEYKADIGLNVLEYGWDRIAPAKRLGALTAIFESAPQMLYKSNETYAAGQPMSLAANDAGLLGQLRADTLDAQTTAVRLLLGKMPQKASDLFGQITLPNRRASCSDALVDDLGSYFQTLALLMRDDRIQTIGGSPKSYFFLTVVRGSYDLERIAPLVSLLGNVTIGNDDLRVAIGYLTQNIQSAGASDREEIALSAPLLSGVSRLLSRMRDAQIPTAQLMAALRTHLTANLSRSYCSDASAHRAAIAASFNALVSPASSGSPGSIGPDKLTAFTAEGSAVSPVIPEDPSAVGPAFRRILLANEARQAANGDPATAGSIEPDSADVDQLLGFALSPADSNSECPLCQLVARGEMFGNLHNFLPAGHLLESWINGEVDFLTSNPLEDEDPPTYLIILKSLIYFSRPVPPEVRKSLSDEAAKGVLPQYPLEEPEFVRKQLRASSDPVIHAYMMYEDLFRPAFAPFEIPGKHHPAAAQPE